jgi:tRNA (guanine-N7-)-methyltransferase
MGMMPGFERAGILHIDEARLLAERNRMRRDMLDIPRDPSHAPQRTPGEDDHFAAHARGQIGVFELDLIVRRRQRGQSAHDVFMKCPDFLERRGDRRLELHRRHGFFQLSSRIPDPMQANRMFIVEPIGLDVETLARPIDWALLFGNSNPVEMEIGMGKGTFLTEQAKARPEVNFFGIEYARFFWRSASDRMRRNGCTNARTVRAEASYFLNEFVPQASLDVMHIYFPDPWPKKRHHKRRLIQAPFLKQVMRVLKPGARLQIVTDHADYFEQMEQVVGASGMRVVDYNRPGSAGDGEFVGTNFERKYRRQGRPFHAIAAINPEEKGLTTDEHS